MSSPRPSLLYVDRRGTLWYGGPRSIDHFGTPSIVVEPELTATVRYGDELLTASSGAVYIGQSDALYRVDPGKPPVRLFAMAQPRAICEDRDKSIWIAAVDRIVRVRGDQRTEFPAPPTETGFYDCGPDSTGRFWLPASTNGMYWRDGVRWRSIPAKDLSATSDPTLMVKDARGQVWSLTDPSTLTRLEGRFAEARPLDAVLKTTGGVRALHATARGILLSGRDGAALMSTGGAAGMALTQAKPLRLATGLAQTPEGDTWLFGAGGLSRVKTADLERAFTDPAFVIPERTFSYEDGLPNGPNAQSSRTMTRGGDGRLWLATIDGVAWIDPAHLPSNPVPPGVAITSLVSGATTIKDPKTIRLKAGSSDITIGFSAINLTMPRRTKVLYRLEGHDPDWVDPGARRQAFYTNLAPGTYRFQVIAANEDGVWNRAGANLEISIPPTFLQSIWFKLLIVAALALLAWALYTLRVRQVAAALEARFQVRTAERERIARELHDTLLQGFQGLMLRFQAVSNQLSGDDALRQDIDKALDRADGVLAEGRTRVRDLRSETARTDLAEALVNLAGDFDDGAAPPIDVVIEGGPRAIVPLVSEEMLRIAEEAIRNAVSHAAATRISVRLAFGRGRLALAIADDGVGLPAAVREAGEREGHYGLKGMRERAERVGGRLAIATRPNGGTEVEVQAPASVAYVDGARAWDWLRGLALRGSTPR
jgi:signal transduction histidine kinase